MNRLEEGMKDHGPPPGKLLTKNLTLESGS